MAAGGQGYILRTDAEGTPLFEDFSLGRYIEDIAMTADGSYIVAGYTSTRRSLVRLKEAGRQSLPTR